MTRKYIQNCTGENRGNEKTSAGLQISDLWSRVIFYVLFFGFISVCTYVIFFAQYLKINNISITGTQELNNQELQQKIEDAFQGKYFGIIPKNNFLFISQKKIESLLMGDFKKIRTASVTRKFPDTMSVVVDERKALLVWCCSDKCFLLDENGTAYSDADFSSPELTQNHLLQITDNSGTDVSIGQKVIDTDYEQFALAIKDAAMKAGWETADQYWTPSRMSQEINVKTTQGPEINFSTQFSLDTAIKTLGAIMKKEIPDDKKNSLAYIDLRNENKVFYKFGDADPPGDPSIVQQSDPSAQSAATDNKSKDKKKK